MNPADPTDLLDEVTHAAIGATRAVAESRKPSAFYKDDRAPIDDEYAYVRAAIKRALSRPVKR